MNLRTIKHTVLQTYIDLKIRSFPFSCSSILEQYQLKVNSYSYLRSKNRELYEICQKFTHDAFTFGTVNQKYLHSMQKAFHKIQIKLLSYGVFSYKITLISVFKKQSAKTWHKKNSALYFIKNKLERLGI